jgi:hypothetical protein
MGKEDVKEKVSKFELPNKEILVKYIRRRKGMASGVNEDHVIAGGMLQGAVNRFSTPLLRNGSIANVLTKEEKETLENLTGLDLSVYGTFWTEHFVSLYKDDNRFNLSNPMDYISYKILMYLKDDIAKTWSERNERQTYKFVITSDNDELDEKKIGLDYKKNAFKLYGKIEDDKDKLLGILKLLTNKPISKDSPLKWIQTKVEEFVDEKPKAFIALLEDSRLETKLLFHSAEEKGIIIKNGNKYRTIDGLELCENSQVPTFDNAILYLDNPKHQDVRSFIEAKILNDK